MRVSTIAAATLFAASAAFGQSAPAPVLDAMRKLDPWIGEWKGAGWSMSPTGQRTEFNLAESVERKVGGTVLLVNGHGTTRTPDGREVTTHDGITLVYYDDKTGRYHWNGHDLTSGTTDADAMLIDGGITWSVKAGGNGATVRFTIRFDDKQWREVGEVSTDGKLWNTIMSVTLTRQGH